MQRVISDDQFQTVIEKRRRWRFTDLLTILMREFGCAPSTAQRAIQRGVEQGRLNKTGRSYRVEPPRSRSANPVTSDATLRRLVPDRLAMLEILSERDD